MAGRRRPRRPPVAAAEGEGITGAIRAPAGPVEVRFDPGSADLPSAVVPTLKARAERLAAGKGTIFIEAHGSQSAGLPRGTVRSIQNLSLGLKRASAIANVLISLGVASDRIKLIVPGRGRRLTPGARRGGCREDQLRGRDLGAIRFLTALICALILREAFAAI